MVVKLVAERPSQVAPLAYGSFTAPQHFGSGGGSSSGKSANSDKVMTTF